jgi:hypothetical protein
MKVFTVGDCDWVIAENVDDAWAVYVEHCGGKREDWSEGEGYVMEEVRGDAPLVIWCGPDGHPGETHVDGNAKVTKSAEQWAAQEPRGFLCSTEF